MSEINEGSKAWMAARGLSVLLLVVCAGIAVKDPTGRTVLLAGLAAIIALLSQVTVPKVVR